MPIVVLRPTSGAPPAPSTTGLPTVSAEIAYTTNPAAAPTYTEVTSYLRDMATGRGRNYEYERAETGTAAFTLSNRDSRFNPENTAGPYYPNLDATRRCRLRATWASTIYDLFVGFTKGYPQHFPHSGFDALVSQKASDMFYPLNMTKFQPGSTTLATAVGDPGQAQLNVGTTGLPMPQAVPFTITVASEDMTVTAIQTATHWAVERGVNETSPTTHPVGAAVTTLSVSFGEELSGTRIQNVLARAGLSSADWNLDQGQSLISASEDLAGQNMLEHLLLIADAENGKLFAAQDGRITFLDRHWYYQNEETARATFGTDPADIGYQLDGPIDHNESLMANIVRVTPASGKTQTSSDAAAVTDHFERVLEKEWPLADDNEAKAATEFMLSQLKGMQLRVPAVGLEGVNDPDVMWPILLNMEIGQRFDFSYVPRGGGSAITMGVIVEGVRHEIGPMRHRVVVQFSPASTGSYYQLDRVGFKELDSATLVLGY